MFALDIPSSPRQTLSETGCSSRDPSHALLLVSLGEGHLEVGSSKNDQLVIDHRTFVPRKAVGDSFRFALDGVRPFRLTVPANTKMAPQKL